MRKTLIAATLGGILALGVALPAAATAPTPAYALVAWEITSTTADHFATPQTIITSVKTNGKGLGQLDALLPCGTKIQLDLYANGEKADALIAGGILYAPGNPHEPWPGGSYQSSYSKVVTTADCIQPPDEATPGSSEVLDCEADQWAITNWRDVVTYVGDRTGYTAQPAVRVNDPDTYRPATKTECPDEVIVVTTTPPPPAPELAHTGPELLAPLLGSMALLGLGVALLVSAARKRVGA